MPLGAQTCAGTSREAPGLMASPTRHAFPDASSGFASASQARSVRTVREPARARPTLRSRKCVRTTSPSSARHGPPQSAGASVATTRGRSPTMWIASEASGARAPRARSSRVRLSVGPARAIAAAPQTAPARRQRTPTTRSVPVRVAPHRRRTTLAPRAGTTMRVRSAIHAGVATLAVSAACLSSARNASSIGQEDTMSHSRGIGGGGGDHGRRAAS